MIGNHTASRLLVLLVFLSFGCQNPTMGSGNNTNLPAAEIKDSNADLAAIDCSSGNLSPLFSPDQINYTLVLESETAEVTIEATPSSSKASVSGAYNIRLEEGQQQVAKIKVTAENGNIKVYSIQVSRKEALPDVNLVTASIINSYQTYTLPFSFYQEKTVLENEASALKRSWQDLYRVGAITGAQYSLEIENINSKLAKDIENLTATYLQRNIYSSASLLITATNENPKPISIDINLNIVTQDGSEYRYTHSVDNLDAESSVNNTITLDTLGKKVTSVTVESITLGL